jgi:hypothetical protein
MTIHPVLLLLGIVLLWFPRQWMRRGVALLQRKRHSSGSSRILDPWKDREPGDPQVNFRTEFTKFRNYVDLFRAAAGSLTIWGGMGIVASIAVPDEGPRNLRWQALALQVLIVLLGALVQALRYERNRVSFYPPIFYLAGLAVGLCGYQAAAFAFVLIWAINPALPNAQAFLTVYALLLTVFGMLFRGVSSPSVLLAGGLTFLPVLLSLLAGRPLMIFTRKGSRTP